MIETRIPIVCRVTLLTGLLETRHFVIRVVCRLEISEVARSALCRQAGVLPANMALEACGCDVRARQREACQIVIERGSGPRTRRVATVALLTECRQRVNRIVCIVVVFNVTGNTFVRSSGIARRMALLTICRQMRAGQLELR